MTTNDTGMGRCPFFPLPRRSGARPSRVGAFTLIELLVVVAIISLLISILLPSLSAARGQAKAVKCGAQLKGVGTGFATYASENNDFFPGLNTTGAALASMKVAINGQPDLLNDNSLPVQTFDWMSPILGTETELPKKRTDRFHLLTNYYKCPSQENIEAEIYDNSYPDLNQFKAYPKPWVALSYLQPIHFQYVGQNDAGKTLTSFKNVPNLKVKTIAAPPDWEVLVENFTPRMARVGPAGEKIMVAEGTRYLDQNLLDFDANPIPTYFGSFTTSGAWWAGSTEYGVKGGSLNWDEVAVPSDASPSGGKNLSLSYRHRKVTAGATECRNNQGAINALFFDTHVDMLNDRQSRKIDMWYPSGGKVIHPNDGMTAVPEGYIIR